MRAFTTTGGLEAHLWTRPLLAGGIVLGWAACSLAPIWKYLSPAHAAMATVTSFAAIALGMLALARSNDGGRQIGLKWMLLLYLIFAATYLLLHPFLQRHTLNRGSDREDALRVELVAMHNHQYPYAARTYLGNLPTPLPGAMLLASPFFLARHIGWQNLLWLALFMGFTLRFFRSRATALLFFVVFLLAAPSNLSDFVSGGDYLTNLFYVILAIAWFVQSLNRPMTESLAATVFLGIAFSSRSIYAVALVPLLIVTLRRTPASRSLLLLLTFLAVAAVVTVPVFLPHPITNLLRQIQQNPGKLRYLPAAAHAQWLLPILGFAVMGTSFFLRTNVKQILLLIGISMFVMLAPPIVADVGHEHRLPFECSYLAIAVLPLALWALSIFEGGGMAKCTQKDDRLQVAELQ